ncbi:MAG TPA: type III-A CRISPR-associated RAMP protein Csm5 [Ignavibacteriaceae bacterium]|nr:type III-A CRISPR-associated RAMP protein Csm5 [Ignavibacteriaceae bacterium]
MIETKIISIKTLSPIHIKGKEFNYGQGFIRRDDSTAYTLDLGRLFGFLLDKFPDGDRLLKNYNILIEKAIKENKIKEFDNEKFLSDNNIYNHANNRTNEKQLIECGAFSSIVHLTSRNEFIKDGKGRPYIPGSAIKGAIRTALLYHALKYYKVNGVSNEATQIINDINQHLVNLDKKLESANNEKEKQRLKKDFLKELELLVFQSNRPDAKKDFLRCIKVKDSRFLDRLQKKDVFVTTANKSFSSINTMQQGESIGEIRLMLGKPTICFKDKIFSVSKNMLNDKIDLLIKNEGKSVIIKEYEKDSIIDYDLIKTEGESYSLSIKIDDRNNDTKETIEVFEGTSHFEIIIDEQIFKSLKRNNPYIDFKGITGLLKVVNDFYKDVWAFEKTFYDKIDDRVLNCELIRIYYNSTQDNVIRIGWGTGLHATTMFLRFDEKIQKKLRNIIFDDRKELIATKSRRLIFENDVPVSPLGWLHFSEA